MTITTREALSLGPLWTALHQFLPHERTTRAVPHVRTPCHWVSHVNAGEAPACRALGLFQEE
jgi:hypothetical protein